MEFWTATLTLFMVMDPFGNTPVFLSVLERVPAERRKQVLIRELLIALAVLLLFLFAGRLALEVLGLTEGSIGIAGGVILFLIAIRMVMPTGDGVMGADSHGEPFIVPLAIPLVAGPSAMATLVLLTTQDPGHLLRWFFATILAWSVSSFFLLSSTFLYRILKGRGLIAIERLMGMVLIAISVQMLLNGIASFFQLPHTQ